MSRQALVEEMGLPRGREGGERGRERGSEEDRGRGRDKLKPIVYMSSLENYIVLRSAQAGGTGQGYM
jgi:hypothetical protein